MAVGQSTQDYLNLIAQYESNNQNIPNYAYDPTHTAQGYYQITNQNWQSIAPVLGIDLNQYPTAMSAPQSVQAQVATYLLTQTPGGISNWSNYNPQLMAALQSAGFQTSGALTDLSGAAAQAPTADILSQLEAMGQNFGIDLTNPATDIVLALAVGALAFMAFGGMD